MCAVYGPACYIVDCLSDRSPGQKMVILIHGKPKRAILTTTLVPCPSLILSPRINGTIIYPTVQLSPKGHIMQYSAYV